MRKPLEGLFVVEMTSYWSATTTARFLRDMGARVVRVETPPIGDFCRYYGRSMGMPITAEENPIHDIFNGGKECVALDLKDPKNLKLMQNMLAKADVFITSTRTAGLKKLGLDWETLHAKYPKLVMGQVTGYGINGPLSTAPALTRSLISAPTASSLTPAPIPTARRSTRLPAWATRRPASRCSAACWQPCSQRARRAWATTS